MKTLVVYASKYGATERYARWLGEETGGKVLELREALRADLTGYDTVAVGGGLYAGGFAAADFLKKRAAELKQVRTALFTVGLSDPEDPANVSHIRSELERAFPAGVLSGIRQFHLRGGMDYGKLGPLHRVMMAMFKKMMEKKERDEGPTAEGRGVLESYGKCVDFTDSSALKPLAAYCRGE